jgi:DNA-binding response OmpR family regulator
MPQLNGLQLYQRLKAINSSVRILFVTAPDAAVELISVLPDIEVNRVIMKPVSRDRFLKYGSSPSVRKAKAASGY